MANRFNSWLLIAALGVACFWFSGELLDQVVPGRVRAREVEAMIAVDCTEAADPAPWAENLSRPSLALFADWDSCAAWHWFNLGPKGSLVKHYPDIGDDVPRMLDEPPTL